jgi:siroheme synthase-like protein
MDFPVCFRVAGERCLVVGGGAVAGRKARALLRAGARVTAVSPDFGRGFPRARRLRRAFRAGDVRGMLLVIAATDDSRVNREVHRACRRAGVPVNVVDVPELCTFTVPSVARRGAVTVAVSTGGLSPSLAKALRERIESMLPGGLGRLARAAGARRRRVLRSLPPSPARAKLLKGLVRLPRAEAR